MAAVTPAADFTAVGASTVEVVFTAVAGSMVEAEDSMAEVAFTAEAGSTVADGAEPLRIEAQDGWQQ
jgi:hypothetical protein